MKLFFSLIILLNLMQLPELHEIREKYPKAVEDKEITEELYHQLEEIKKDGPPVYVAYKGAVLVLKAKHTNKLFDKKSYFEEGAELIDKAVSDDSENMEIRSLRLGIQENAPGISGYKSNIEEDKLYILEHFAEITNSSLKKYILDFVINSKSFSEKEKKTIQ